MLVDNMIFYMILYMAAIECLFDSLLFLMLYTREVSALFKILFIKNKLHPISTYLASFAMPDKTSHRHDLLLLLQPSPFPTKI